jgi:hypothetical protein
MNASPLQLLGLGILVPMQAALGQVWVRHYDGPVRQNDYGNAVALGPGGTVAIAGRSQGLGSGADYATVKYDAAGEQLWAARFTSAGNAIDQADFVGMDGAGNVCVTGQSWGGLRPAGGEWDYVTIKYDTATGQPLWTRRYNGPGNWSDTVTAMAVDAAGNAYLCGFVFKEPDQFDRYATHFHVLKYDPAGNIGWEHQLDGSSRLGAGARALTVDAAGNVYATGLFNAGDPWNANDDIMTVRIDPAGNVVYAARWDSGGNNKGHDDGLAIAVDTEGNALVAGRYMDDLSEEHKNTVVLKYGPTGALLWSATAHLPYPDGPSSIATDTAGNTYVGGGIAGQTDDDGLMWSLSPQGATRWMVTFDQPQEWDQQYIVSVNVGPDGNVHALGDIQYTDGYWPTLYTYTPAGTKIAETRFDVGSGNSTSNGFAIAPDGTMAIGGWRAVSLTLADFFTIRVPGGGPGPCYANCDKSTAVPTLNVQDFTCFLQKFAAADSYANCDASTTSPVLNVQDFTCFLQKFAAGCP